MSDRIFELRNYRTEAQSKDVGVAFPVILVVCKNCGHTRMVNAIALGVVAPDPEDKGAIAALAEQASKAGGKDNV